MCMRTAPGLLGNDRASLRRSEALSGVSPQVAFLPVLLPAEMDEQPAEVLGVFLHPMVERLDLLLLQEPEHVFLELPGALAGDNLDQRRLLPDGLIDDVPERAVDVLAAGIDIVQVELELHLSPPVCR